MKYRKIPFVNSSPLMSGLTPLVAPRLSTLRGFGPQFANSSMLGATSMSKFFGEESAINDNGIRNQTDMMFRTRSTQPFGLSGLGAASGGTVIMRPLPGAPAGFPGFFAWLKAVQPAMWNYAKVALPAYTTQAEGHRTGGATLQGLGAYMGQVHDWLEARAYQRGAYNPQEFSGLGDDTITMPDTSSAMIFSTPTIDVPLPTVNIPDPSAETAAIDTPPNPGPGVISQIVSTLAQAAPQILSTVNQQTMFNTQLSRAKAGLPPLNTSSFGLTSALSSSSLLPIGLGVAAIAAFLLLKRR